MAKVKEVIITDIAYENKPVDDKGNPVPLSTICVKDASAGGKGNSNNSYVRPFGPLKQIPLIGEQVMVVQGPSWNASTSTLTDVGYYYPPFNVHNNINIGILPKTFLRNTSAQDATQYRNSFVPIRELASKVHIGETFKEVPTVKPIQPYEGDTILEGRFGQSIRMSSTIIENKHPLSRKGKNVYEIRGCDDWQGDTSGAPITWITNGLKPIAGSAQYTAESFENDASTICLTAGQKLVTFQTAQPNLGPDVRKSNIADVNQVIINSDRLVFNAKKEHIVLSAKRSVTVATPDWAADMNEVLSIMDEFLKIMQRITNGSSAYPTTPGLGNGPTLANPAAGQVAALVRRMAALKQ